MSSHDPTTLSQFQIVLPTIVLALAYVFISLEKIPKVVIALLGASIVLLAHVMTQEQAFHAIDFNVIFLLVGMMILVNILSHTGALQAMAVFSAQKVKGNGLMLMLVFSVITAFLSAFLDNVTTVIIMGMLTCSIARQLDISPVPYLIAETLASNIGGSATLIGDPPNIMVGSAAGLSFQDFLIHLAPVILLILPVVLLTLVLLYKDQYHLPPSAQQAIEAMNAKKLITDKPLMFKSLIVLGCVVVGFIFHHQLGLEAATVALAGASVLLIFENSKAIWHDVEWTTIFFFIGLFIIVGAVEEVGTISYLADRFFEATQGNFQLTTVALLWMSGILSAIIDNIPYTATMIPLVEDLGRHYENLNPLWWSLALGACLGGNGTMIGASANVLVADLALRNNHPIRFLEFMKIGSLVMVESLIISSVYIWFRYLQ